MPAPDDGPTPALAAPPDALCLDFANTRYWRGTPSPAEELTSPAALLRWCTGAGTAAPAWLDDLAARWDAAPADADATHAEALALRETIFRLFAAGAAGEAPQPADLAALNAALAAAPPRARLRCDAPGDWQWEVAAPPDATAPPLAPSLLAPVLWSAGDLLAGPRRARVRQCANPQCGWLFLDDSKSGNRRWCSMASCGNRAKAHRHYARQKGAMPQGGP